MIFGAAAPKLCSMITFNLKCSAGHEFEGWFSSSGDYDRQLRQGLVSCPVCGSGGVSKALMAPNVGAKANSQPAPATPPVPPPAASHPTMQVSTPPGGGADAHGPEAPGPEAPGPEAPGPEAMAAAYTALRTLQRKVESECDYVGNKFAEEARKIHYGEAEERGIYGQSSSEDAKALEEEGVNFSAMPWLPPEN